MWAAIVISVLVFYLAYTQSPRTVEREPATLKDVNAPTAEEGRPIPVLFGRRVIKSLNVVWYGDLDYKKVQTKGGK